MRLRCDRMHGWVKNLIRCDKGAVAILVALAAPVLFGAAALGIDLSRLYVTKTKLQDAADAAAFGAAQKLPDSTDTDVKRLAKSHASASFYAEKREGGKNYIIKDEDITIGVWTSGIKDCEVTGSGDNVNAVKVVTRRAEQNGNPVNLFFAPIFELLEGSQGQKQSDVAACAIAARTGGSAPGTNSCFIARAGDFTVNGNVRIIGPNCGLGTDGELKLSGGGNESRNLKSVTFNTYKGKTPEMDFGVDSENVFRQSDTFADNPEGQEAAESFSKFCTLKEKGKKFELESPCTIPGGLYRVPGSFEIKGNEQLSVTGDKPLQLIIDGDLKMSGNPQIAGCAQFNAVNVKLSGTSDINGICTSDNAEPFPGDAGSGSVRLVR